MKNLYFKIASTYTVNVYDNNFDTNSRAFVPELWARESLMVLEENLVAAKMVHRDFENVISEHGDVVNTRRPGKFTARRKGTNDDVTIQPATATKVAVTLNQHLHTSILLRDKELSLSFIDLVSQYLTPAIVSIARQVDQIVLSQRYRFLANSVGKLGTTIGKSSIIGVDTMFNNNLVPEEGRWGIVSPGSKGDILNVEQFTDADKFGDGGKAIKEASIGKLYNTNWVVSQNLKTIDGTALTTVTGAINNGAGYAAGTTSITVDGLSAAIVAGTWITIAGDGTPQQVQSTTGGSTPTAMVISPGLKYPVVNDAVITVYTPGDVNEPSNYAAGYDGVLATTIFASGKGPQIGQMVTFGVTSPRYSALDLGLNPSTGAAIARHTSLSLDRPLVNGVADADVIGVGPAGNYNFVFHRNAISLVNRPLALPPSAAGVQSAVVEMDGISIRITMQYLGMKQGLLITADTLMGVEVLDTALGGVLLG